MATKPKPAPSRAKRMYDATERIRMAAERVNAKICESFYLTDSDLKTLRAEAYEITAACDTYAEANKP